MTQPAAIAPARQQPSAAQTVTVVQPSDPAMMLDVSTIGGWAVSLAAIAAVIALIYKLLTRDLARDISDVRREQAADKARIDLLEHQRVDDVARLVRTEGAVDNIKELLSRIEGGMNGRFDEVVASIREIRSVRPRA